MIDWVLTLIAYLLGSLSSAIIVCRVMELPDPRSEGSGNPGTTNVLRIGGKKAALATLVGDFLKGYLPVLLMILLHRPDAAVVAVMVAALCGHMFPLFFKFQGGKGVATAAGCLFGLALPIGVAAVLTWLLVAAITRYSSLAALIAALAAPLYAHWIIAVPTVTAGIVVVSATIVIRHRQNIRNLLRGTESRIGGSIRSENG